MRQIWHRAGQWCAAAVTQCNDDMQSTQQFACQDMTVVAMLVPVLCACSIFFAGQASSVLIAAIAISCNGNIWNDTAMSKYDSRLCVLLVLFAWRFSSRHGKSGTERASDAMVDAVVFQRNDIMKRTQQHHARI